MIDSLFHPHPILQLRTPWVPLHRIPSRRLRLLNLPTRRCIELVVNLLRRDQGRARVEAVLGPDHCGLALGATCSCRWKASEWTHGCRRSNTCRPRPPAEGGESAPSTVSAQARQIGTQKRRAAPPRAAVRGPRPSCRRPGRPSSASRPVPSASAPRLGSPRGVAGPRADSPTLARRGRPLWRTARRERRCSDRGRRAGGRSGCARGERSVPRKRL